MANVERPISYKQELSVRSNADIIMLTGVGGGGKTRIVSGCVLATNVHFYPGIRIAFLTKNYGDYIKQGGILKEIKSIFPLNEFDKKIPNAMGSITTSMQNMALRFNDGTVVGFYATEDMSREQLTAASKTFQYDILIVEEAQKLSWETINIFATRLRNPDPTIPNKVYIIQNPERDCPLRRMIGNENDQAGWVDENGDVIPEKNCTVMYMFQNNGNVHETYWGRTMKECYNKCKGIIDSKIGDNQNISYKNFILKVLFIGFDKSDNKAIFEGGKYLARLAQSAIGASMGDSNWNFSAKDEPEDTESHSLSFAMITKCFFLQPLNRQFKGISFDLAGMGTDNSIAVYIEGWHVKKVYFDDYTVGEQRIDFIDNFANENEITMNNKNSVIDGNRFDDVAMTFAKRCFAIDGKGRINKNKLPFKTFSPQESPYNEGRYNNRKSQCAYLLMKLIKNGIITFAPELENMPFKHRKVNRKNRNMTFKDEVVYEVQALRFYHKNGKICLITKEEQKGILSNRSMDFIDCLIQYVDLFIDKAYMELSGKNVDRSFYDESSDELGKFKSAFHINQNRKNAVVSMENKGLFEKLMNF